jgi:hypothetical protein
LSLGVNKWLAVTIYTPGSWGVSGDNLHAGKLESVSSDNLQAGKLREIGMSSYK